MPSNPSTAPRLPLEGLRVVEFTHMVMGPTCGMVLADLGAEVIKVEPVEGDRTRHLLGAGAGLVAVAITGPSLAIVAQTTVVGLILGGIVGTVRRAAV